MHSTLPETSNRVDTWSQETEDPASFLAYG